MTRILIIEDDHDINNILNGILTGAGYEVLRAFDGAGAAPLIKTDPDLILMDLMLPDTTGEELLKTVSAGIPVIAVSARSTVEDKVDLLSLGCIDYVTKPFDNKELLARVEVALKFKRKNVSYSLGNLTLDDSSHAALIDGKPVRLTPTEYAIIKVLMIDQDRVISKSELLSEAVKYTPDLVEESLKVHMSNLRRKLKQSGSNVEIGAVWGIGFKLTVS
ncbi:MAG: response regulator transcription factor [Clostridiales bacterium]|nr:response regulator transcription factor [Clostridiales bacterium]